MLVIKILLLFVFFYDNIVVSNQNKLKVSVFYASMCKNSRRFITNQAYPAYLKLSSVMELELVPAAGLTKKKDFNGEWTFVSSFGLNDTFSDKLQSCLLYSQLPETMEFINCLNSYDVPGKYGYACAKQLGLLDAWHNSLEQCQKGKLGSRYLSVLADRYNQMLPKIGTFVPQTTFDDNYSEKYDQMANENLINTVCTILNFPPVCTRINIRKYKRKALRKSNFQAMKEYLVALNRKRGREQILKRGRKTSHHKQNKF